VSWLLCCGGCCFIAAVHNAYAAPLTFSNTNFISLGENQTLPTPAVPYPSTNIVSGLSGLVLQKVTVTLQGFSHTFPSDVDILLVGPQGQQTLLMGCAGGQNKYSVTNLTLTFDDDATNSLPVGSALTNGVFKPTDGCLALGYLPPEFPPPAPAGSNAPAALSVFKNTDADGTWNLFALSDGTTDSGSIANGWSLNLTLAVPVQITHSGTNVVVSWPGSISNCTLQLAAILSAQAWSNVLTTPALGAGRFNVTNPVYPGNGFYRLIKN